MGDSLHSSEGCPEDSQDQGGARRQESDGARWLQESLAPPPVPPGEYSQLAGDTGPLESGLLPIKH